MRDIDGVTDRHLRYNITMHKHCKLQRADKHRPPAFAGMRLLAVILLAITQTGCSGGGPGEAFEQYLSRLSRTLSVPYSSIPTPTVRALPAPRDLRLDITPGNLDALDFLAISGCAVQITIGKRNSSLGRMARDSQRLLLDLEYLRLAPACIDYQRRQGDANLADTLQQAWTLKFEQLPASIYNATLAGSEYREFWRASPYPSADYPANTSSAVIASLQAINGHARRWLAGDFSADNREFEILLGEVATGDGGTLMRALAGQDAALEAASAVLLERMKRGPLCSPTIRPEASDILVNVIHKYFIAAIQPRAAALNRRYHDLLPPIAILEQMVDSAIPDAYREWQIQRDEKMRRWVTAPRQHVARLQEIQRPCDAARIDPDN